MRDTVDSHGLSSQDIEALRLYASGISTVDIALRMNVKFDIARDHLNHVRAYYASQGVDVEAKRDLVRCATEDGLLNTSVLTLPPTSSPHDRPTLNAEVNSKGDFFQTC